MDATLKTKRMQLENSNSLSYTLIVSTTHAPMKHAEDRPHSQSTPLALMTFNTKLTENKAQEEWMDSLDQLVFTNISKNTSYTNVPMLQKHNHGTNTIYQSRTLAQHKISQH